MKGLVDFAREHLGLEFYSGQAEVLNEWAASGKRKAILALGRRSGKGLMAAVAAIYNATVEDYAGTLRPGEARFIIVVAVRQEQAREFIRTVRELMRAAPDPDLASLVDLSASTLDEIVFKTGVVIRAMPCSSRSTRGLPISLLILDEAAHMATTEDGFAAGKQVYRALLPSTAQFGDRGYVMLTSSPLWASGVFFDLYQAGVTEAADDVFVARRPTWEMNGTITRESLESEFRADPDSARVEYGAEFAEGAGAFLTALAIAECVKPNRLSLPPLPGVNYFAAADPAFAAGGDAFTFAVGHRVGTGDELTYVLDRLECWRGKTSPLNSDTVLDEIAAIAGQYRIQEVVSDQYAVIPIADGLSKRGIRVRAQPLTSELKADIYGSLKRALNTGRVELLDDPQLVAELIHLEIRPTPSGKPRIQATGSFKDDRAMAVATVTYAMAKRKGPEAALQITRELIAEPVPAPAVVETPAPAPTPEPVATGIHCGAFSCASWNASPAIAQGRKTNLCPTHRAEFRALGWLTADGRSTSIEELFSMTARFRS